MSNDESDSVFDDDDEELQLILMADSNPTAPPSSSRPSSKDHLPQRTLDGFIIGNKPRYEEIVVAKPVDIPTHHNILYANLATYIYPTNLELRDYQYNVVQRAFYDNLLVALPTGLGKTFIASTVMLNFYRWFPQAKIIFMAPTKPLVAQQVKACCSIAGIPATDVAVLLDKVRKNRGEIWDSKQVFFTTPQVVENDLASGLVDPKSVSLLVIDEAHRSRGNYAYNNVVKFLKRFNTSFRILALTATPASDVDGVQEIIDNLLISKIEVRTERSIDIIRYMKRKKIERKTLGQSQDILECVDYLCTAIDPVLKIANERKIYDMRDPLKINFFQCMDASKRLAMNRTIPEALKWSNFFVLQLLGVVGQCFRRLNIYGIKSFYSYFSEKRLEFTTKWNKKKSKNKLNADFYYHEAVVMLMKRSEELLKDPKNLSHPKIEAVMEELKEFFILSGTKDSKVIIFTEFRESALEIVQSIEAQDDVLLKPHIFIGQAKEKDKFDEVKYAAKHKKPTKRKRKADEDEEEEEEQLDTPQETAEKSSSEYAQMKGMNQKLQKQIIKEFKGGTYNVLVATSIGEEGLDIGEVDLIICYDSTSSPIKNIQRMGRTGRKRDGKVLLLFSGNEESKFDKAMEGYEYIQKHIMTGNVISLAERNRIIPNEYTPIVEKKFIEAPEINLDIINAEDEDQIIRLATQYMIGKTAKGKSRQKKQKKQEKRFFMPDHVETGFRSVTSMIREIGDTKSLEERNRDKDFLDSIVGTQSEEDVPLLSKNILNESSTENENEDEVVIVGNKDEFAAEENHIIEPQQKNLGYDHLGNDNEYVADDDLGDESNEEVFVDDEVEDDLNVKISDETEDSPNDKIISEPSEPINSELHRTFPEDNLDLPNYTVNESSNGLLEQEETSDEEFFDDGLDEELAKWSSDRVSQSNSESTNTQTPKPQPEEETLYKNELGEREGLLNSAQYMELYTSYFTTIDPSERISFYDPAKGVHLLNGKTSAFCGIIGHSKKSEALINVSGRNPSVPSQNPDTVDVDWKYIESFVVED